MKSQIKQVMNMSDIGPFYIETIHKETKYHYILENMFNMSIDEIIREYWSLRQLRVAYCHPFG